MRKIFKISMFSIWLILILAFNTGTYGQDVFLKISYDGVNPVPIAISPFPEAGDATILNEIKTTLLKDLEFSGFFQVIDFPNENGQNDQSIPNIPPSANALLETSFIFSASHVLLNGQLLELPNKKTIFSKKYFENVKSVRCLAHHISDDIHQYLIGERGIAATKIAFVKNINSVKEIFTMDYDGLNVEQLTNFNSLCLSPCWSPSDERIAFTSYVSGNPDLMSINMINRSVSKLSAQKGLNTAPAWSPDGKKIALTLTKDGNAEIYLFDVKNGGLLRLTNSMAIDSSPSWSPNGRELVFTSDRSSNPQVYVMDAEGSNVRRITYNGSYNDSPVWSPKGDLIAFVSREDGQFQIYTIDINGENLQKITAEAGNYEDPSWSPDGIWISFASNRDGKWDIYRIRRDGTRLTRITKSGGCTTPAWSPRFLQK